eukprot:6185390-Pleurochrysis_carterae.AAC.1
MSGCCAPPGAERSLPRVSRRPAREGHCCTSTRESIPHIDRKDSDQLGRLCLSCGDPQASCASVQSNIIHFREQPVKLKFYMAHAFLHSFVAIIAVSNSIDISFAKSAQRTTYVVTVTSGLQSADVSWVFECDDGSRLEAGAPPFASTVQIIAGSLCSLTMRDSKGDGWNGALWSGVGQQGLTLSSGFQEVVRFVAPLPEADLEPPTPPPATARPPMPPATPTPPALPGVVLAASIAQLRFQLAAAAPGSSLEVYLLPGEYDIGESELVVGSLNLTLFSTDDGARIACSKPTRLFRLAPYASLMLSRVHLANGQAQVRICLRVLDGFTSWLPSNIQVPK